MQTRQEKLHNTLERLFQDPKNNTRIEAINCLLKHTTHWSKVQIKEGTKEKQETVTWIYD